MHIRRRVPRKRAQRNTSTGVPQELMGSRLRSGAQNMKRATLPCPDRGADHLRTIASGHGGLNATHRSAQLPRARAGSLAPRRRRTPGPRSTKAGAGGVQSAAKLKELQTKHDTQGQLAQFQKDAKREDEIKEHCVFCCAVVGKLSLRLCRTSNQESGPATFRLLRP